MQRLLDSFNLVFIGSDIIRQKVGGGRTYASLKLLIGNDEGEYPYSITLSSIDKKSQVLQLLKNITLNFDLSLDDEDVEKFQNELKKLMKGKENE
ncbi:MAG: hypothetical protein PF689_09205 [Deltaproteobacteria bacterium]|jgi:hypothetical protein|nr:hypothetical protein [Deltaproteobacteria bacterium]